MKCLVWLLVFCFAICIFLGNGLIWPSGTAKIQFIMGFGIPVDLQNETLILGLVIKGNYRVPSNISEWHYNTVPARSRQKRGLSRWEIYKFLEQEAEMRGYGGKSCVLRSICEASESPLDQNHGFFNEIFHTTFTPSATKEPIVHHSNNLYLAAEKLGKDNPGFCHRFFPECHQTFFKRFTSAF